MNRAPVDQRSVGELLLDADLMARRVLLDVSGHDAPAMLRTWGELVQTAGELWSALPTDMVASDPAEAATMTQLEVMSQTMHRAQLRRNWPGDGPADERLLAIADTVARATELVTRHGQHVEAATRPVRADVQAARMRLMHTLYLTAHGVGVAVHQHIRDVRASTGPHADARITRAIPRGKDAVAQLAAFEQLAGSYVGTRFATQVHGEHNPPPGSTSRLHQALVSWDIQSHRTLAAAPTPANLHLAARTQAGMATASAVVLHAAACTGHLDPDTHRTRLGPALDRTQQAWTQLAGGWAQLVTRGTRPDPALVHAAGEVRAAIYEVAYDRTAWAAPEVMAQRVDLAQALSTIQHAASATVEAACLHRDIAEHDPELSGPARTMASHLAGHVANTGGLEPAEEGRVWVSPADAHANRTIPIPEPVRHSLSRAGDVVVASATTAMWAGAALADPGPPQDGGLRSRSTRAMQEGHELPVTRPHEPTVTP